MLEKEKHPIILPHKTKFAELIISNAHEKVYHSAVAHKLVKVRDRFWLLKRRQTIKSLLKKYVTRKRIFSNPGDLVVAPLPPDHIEQSPPFGILGCDFACHLFVKTI